MKVEKITYGVRRWLRLEKTFSVVKSRVAESWRCDYFNRSVVTYFGLARYLDAMISARRIARPGAGTITICKAELCTMTIKKHTSDSHTEFD